MPLKTIRLNEDVWRKLSETSRKTGISIARIASDGIEKEIKRLEEIFKK